MWFEARKPSHSFDPVTRYIRGSGSNREYISLSPGLFEIGESRILVEKRLKESSFNPAKGTLFAQSNETEYEEWFRRDQFLALWHFSVHVAFDAQDRLVLAEGLVAGPVFK